MKNSVSPWILGGDFNLLPPGQSALLSREERGLSSEPTEICSIYERYTTASRPSQRQQGKICDATSLSHSVLAQTVSIVRTLDYFFAAPRVTIEKYAVVRKAFIQCPIICR